ncbi:MAG: HAD family phosphatase [Bacteroidetes bacterium]|nr:HAD family phosphatase [Bacteroidota bacterium]
MNESIHWERIQAVWFDMGGVLLDIDPAQTREALTRLLGMQSGGAQVRFDIHNQETLFLDFERGYMSAEDFRSQVRQTFDAAFTDADFDDAWCAVLKDPFPWAFEAVDRATRRYRTALLSNTNAIHFQRFYPAVSPMLQQMEHVFVSHELHTRKPEQDIYLKALAAMELQPEQVLFIEDNAENVIQARALGLQVVHLTQPEMLQSLTF